MPGLFVHCAPPLGNQRHPSHPHPHPSLQDFYSLTLDSMAESKNERLWFKTNMKLANLWVGLREGSKAAKVGAGPGLGCRGVVGGSSDVLDTGGRCGWTGGCAGAALV